MANKTDSRGWNWTGVLWPLLYLEKGTEMSSTLRQEIREYSSRGLVFKKKISEFKENEDFYENPFIATCLFYILINARGELFHGDRQEFYSSILLMSCQPGLLATSSLLDYVAVASASHFMDYSVALFILNYGKSVRVKLNRFLKVRYFYNNYNPGKRSMEFDPITLQLKGIHWAAWFGSKPWLICHFEICAWQRPSLFHQLCWVLKLMQLALFVPESKDPALLAGLLILPVEKDPPLVMKLGIWFWDQVTNTERLYPSVYKFFGGLTHPVAKFWSAKN